MGSQCPDIITCYTHTLQAKNIHFIDVQDDFSTKRDNLWCWDGVHLSDTDGAPLYNIVHIAIENGVYSSG